LFVCFQFINANLRHTLTIAHSGGITSEWCFQKCLNLEISALFEKLSPRSTLLPRQCFALCE